MNKEVSQMPNKSIPASNSFKKAWLVIPAALVIGAALAFLDDTGRWLAGWVSYSTIAAVSLALIWAAGRLVGASQAWGAAWTAFILRLGVGVLLFLIFPAAGYPDNRATQAGYTFDDAYVRDVQAWNLAVSDAPLVSAFTGSYPGDQYGGMLWLSTGVYRYLSPDLHRPVLILILGAALGACGVFLAWKAGENWFGPKVGMLAGWIFALYPEGLLLGSSQMREPYVMTAAALGLFSLSIAKEKRRLSFAGLAAAILLLLVFQPPAALFLSLMAAGVWFFDPRHKFSWKHAAGFTLILVITAGLVIAVWSSLPSLSETQTSNVLFTWFYNNFVYQTHLTERSSGWLQRIFDQIGEQWQMPFVLTYGITRPVLPAALGDKASVVLIWRVINIFRAAGWYALALPLVYGIFSVIRSQKFPRRAQVLWLFSMVWVWILVSSAVAGGDMWDNPRYRTIFLVFQALLAGWALNWAVSQKDPWLLRWFNIELAAVAGMTVWYLSRNYIPWFSLDIWPVLGFILGMTAYILVRGWRQDRRDRREVQPLNLG
jgi:hypothetical protein